MIKLLGRKTSGNVQKVLFCWRRSACPTSAQDYGRQFENTATPEYKALNPTSKVPTLVDGDTVIWESNTILRYLAAKERAAADRRDAGRAHRGRALDGFPAGGGQPRLSRGLQGRQADARGADRRIRGADQGSAARRWRSSTAISRARTIWRWAGSRIADIALAPILKRCLDFKIERPAMPNLERWMAAISAGPPSTALQRHDQGGADDPRVALIGLGTMGPGIAARLARGGLDVAAFDVSPAAIERARAHAADRRPAFSTGSASRRRAAGAGSVRFATSLADAVDGRRSRHRERAGEHRRSRRRSTARSTR